VVVVCSILCAYTSCYQSMSAGDSRRKVHNLFCSTTVEYKLLCFL
jgi:hypothetical protein